MSVFIKKKIEDGWTGPRSGTSLDQERGKIRKLILIRLIRNQIEKVRFIVIKEVV